MEISRAQVTVTPNEAKRLIAKGVAALPEVQNALKNGKILLKGGSTVSAIAEELGFPPLRLSGRISARGSVGSAIAPDAPHSVLIENGKIQSIDASFAAVAKGLGRGDVIICGANAIDNEGNAAMMAGADGGGNPGEAWGAFYSEGATIIIAAGIEKMIPGTIKDALTAAGRKGLDYSIGMAIGLLPLYGKLITERDALEILGCDKATVISAGGIMGGEGSSCIAIEGGKEIIKEIFGMVLNLKNAPLSGFRESLEECTGPGQRCKPHLACVYKKGIKGELQ